VIGCKTHLFFGKARAIIAKKGRKMYKIIGTPTSRAFRVIWMMEEIGQPYELVPVKAGSDEAKAYNPSGKVPALMVDDTILTDSAAIMMYLADKHNALTYPAGTLDRARQDGFLHRVNDEFDAILWTAARHSFVLPPEHRVAEAKPSLKWEFARNVDRLMSEFTGPYLMGDMCTVPDLILTHCGGWAISAGFPMENEAFKAYAKRVRSSDAFARARAAT
jgi:glutathione S-transferase